MIRRLTAATGMLIIISVPCELHPQVADPQVAASAPVPGNGHNYIGIGAETVNPADGSLSFDLPLKPPAGRGLSMTFGIRFSGKELFYPSNDNTSTLSWYAYADTGESAYEKGGWSYDLPIITSKYSVAWQADIPDNGCPNGDCTFALNKCWTHDSYVFRGLDGTQYSLPIGTVSPDPSNTDSGFCPTAPANVKSPGNNHGVLSWLDTSSNLLPVTVVDQSGTTYQFSSSASTIASSITDRNGNQITQSGNGYKDPTGRTAIAWTGFGNDGDQVTVSGLGGPVTVHWTTATATFPENYKLASSNGPACTLADSYVGGVYPAGTSVSLPAINEIDLPNGQKYSFEYDGTYGMINKIIFPDGGYVRYQWGVNPLSMLAFAAWTTQANGSSASYTCSIEYDAPAITDRYVSFNGSTEVLHQHFDYAPTQWNGDTWTQKQTTVTTTDEVTGQQTTTIYTYGAGTSDSPAYAGSNYSYFTEVPVETQVVYEDGGGKAWKTVNKTWENPSVMASEQAILDNGQGNATIHCFDANEEVTNTYEYGFQSEGSFPGYPTCDSGGLNTGAIGPLERQTTTVYHPFFSWTGGLNSGTFTGTHIVNAPDSVTVADGSGSTARQTLYTYDQFALQGSGAINLGNPGTTRGNATTVQQRINASTTATTTYQYYDTGQIYTKADPCGNGSCSDMAGSSHTTTYSYSDNYASGTGTPPGQTFAYLTQVTDPLGHSNYFTWGYNDGLIRSHKDPNLQTTSYQYNDLLARLTEIDGPPDPNNGNNHWTTQVCYNDSAPNPSMTVSELLNTASGTVSCRGTSGMWKNAVTVMDGMNHPVQTQLTSDPVSTDYQDTLYTGLGQVYQQSNPTRCSSSPGALPSSCSESSWGYETYSYDALGRKMQLTHSSDGSSQGWSYNGPTVTFTDENGNQWQRTSDGLGRLAQVLEPNGKMKTAAMQTSYTYDALNDLLSVVQQGDGSGNRNRYFAYDDLGHLLAAMNPETTGSVNYLPPGDSTPPTGSTAPAAVSCPGASNPSYSGSWTTCYGYDLNGNVASKVDNRQITVSYSYDADNRVTQKSYSDGTLAERFGYDGKDENGNAISGEQYAVGHLTKSSNEVNAESVYYYDVMGRTQEKSSCIPGDCNWDINVNTGYDLAGGVTSLTNGSPLQPITLTYGYNAAAQLQSLTSSWTPDANHPLTLFQANSTSGSAPAYSPAGGLTNASLGIPSGSQNADATEVRSYDGRLRVASEGYTGTVELTAPTGSITIPTTDTEQSKQINLSSGTGWFNVSGSENTTTVYYTCGPYGQQCSYTVPDVGYVSVTINGTTYQYNYGANDTSSTIANSLLGSINGGPDTNASLSSCTSTSCTVSLTARATGAASDYSLSATSWTTNTSYFTFPSFTASVSGNTMTGGSNGTTVYDTGTITATVNGVNATANWGQGDTPTTLASKLASSINSAMGGFLSASASTNVVTLTSRNEQYWNISGSWTDTNTSNFSSPSFTASWSGMSVGSSSETVYNYTVGYDAVSNVTSLSDSVMGSWNSNLSDANGNTGYDTLNRLVAWQTTGGPYFTSGTNTYGCWTYDGFGNRKMEAISKTACNSSPTPTTWANYNTGNQITGTNAMSSGDWYDAAGDVVNDGKNQYLYDGAGRICAVKNIVTGGMTQYIYDAEGNRVAKGSISSFSCGSGNGFTLNTQYIVGIAGEQLGEQTVTNGASTWAHSNVFAGGALIATYAKTSSGSNTYFDLADWQGTRRAELGADGCLTGWLSLPFGDNTSGSNPLIDPEAVSIGNTPQCQDATEHHYMGKPHDAETGNDDFGARYYTDIAGRWLSPDWAAAAEAVPYANFNSPQTLNLYSFVGNNPLSGVDADGHCNPGTGDKCAKQKDDEQKATGTNANRNDTQQGQSGTEDRIISGVSGALNLGIGVEKGTTAIEEMAAAPATNGATLVLGGYEAVQTVGQAAAGLVQIAGAISGDTATGDKLADESIVHTSIAGYIAYKKTGSTTTGASWAAIEGMVSSGLTRSIFKNAGNMIDTAMNIIEASKPPKPHNQNANSPSQ